MLKTSKHYPNDTLPQGIERGQWVEVKSLGQIESTLDSEGTLEGMPFMPEMAKYCGQRLRVTRFANQVCANIGTVEIRHLSDVVVLEMERCDGQFHGGCEMGCDYLWKTTWLKSVDGASDGGTSGEPLKGDDSNDQEIHQKLVQLSQATDNADANQSSPCYRCQATQLGAASTRTSAFNLQQYRVERQTNGISIFNIGSFLANTVLRKITRQNESCHGPCRKTPVARLNLKVGDQVRVKSFDEILKTLNAKGCNRGLWFDEAEMRPFCGRVLTLTRVINRLVNEHTGELMELDVPSVVLNETQCSGLKRRFCGRGMLHFWREVWLERVE